jgi:hypothetical protein
MPTAAKEALSVDQLQTELQKKLQLYQNCYELTLRIGEAVRDGEVDLVLRLLRRREVIFRKIRVVDEHVGISADGTDRLGPMRKQVPAIAALWAQIRELIQKIVSADSDLYNQMATKRTEALKALAQNYGQHRLAKAYRPAGAPAPRLVDSDL